MPGSADRGPRPARQVPAARLDGGRHAGHAPADDREPAARQSEPDQLAYLRVADRARRRRGPAVHRRAALREAFLLEDARARRATSPPCSAIEPLSDAFTAEALAELAAGRRAPLKSFPARSVRHRRDRQHLRRRGAASARGCIRCHRPGSMRREHVEALRDGHSRQRSRPGSRSGGASIDDYRDSRGEQGSMQDEFLVHTREGQPCPRCGEQIRRIVVGGRSTYFCPGCQKRLRRRRRPPAAGRARRGRERDAAASRRASRSGTGPTRGAAPAARS